MGLFFNVKLKTKNPILLLWFILKTHSTGNIHKKICIHHVHTKYVKEKVYYKLLGFLSIYFSHLLLNTRECDCSTQVDMEPIRLLVITSISLILIIMFSILLSLCPKTPNQDDGCCCHFKTRQLLPSAFYSEFSHCCFIEWCHKFWTYSSFSCILLLIQNNKKVLAWNPSHWYYYF